LLYLAAINAASLQTLAYPENPEFVWPELVSKPSTFFNGVKCTLKISARHGCLVNPQIFALSKRPAH
jgi:hypothetical protein